MFKNKSLLMLVLILSLGLSFNLLAKTSSVVFYDSDNNIISDELLSVVFSEKDFNKENLQKKINNLENSLDYKIISYEFSSDILKIYLKKKQKIASYSIFGNKSIKLKSIKKSFTIDPIGEYCEDVCSRIADNVKNKYEMEGFLKANISYEMKSDKLVLNIIEGERFLVSKINILGFDEKKTKKIMQIKENTPFYKNLLFDGLNRLKSYFNENKYYSYNIKNQKVEYDENRVNIYLEINRGPKYDFIFIGNKYIKDKKKLKEILNITELDRLTYDYYSVLSLRLKNYYLENGFLNTKIDIKEEVSDKKDKVRLVFHISEGDRYLLGEVNLLEIDGEIKKELEKYIGNLISSFKDNSYLEKYYLDFQKEIQNFLSNKGYLRNRVRRSYKKISLKNVVDLYYNISLGPAAKIRKIDFKGSSIERKEMLNLLGLNEYDQIDINKLNTGINNILNYYRKLGYVDVKITNKEIINFTTDYRFVECSIDISEGNKYKFGKTHIVGLNKTNEIVVNRELRFDKSDVASISKVKETENEISSLGLFSSVDTSLLESSSLGPEYRDVLVKVKERKVGSYEFGFGYRTEQGLVAFSGINYGNISGMNRKVTVNGELNLKLDDRYDFVEYNVSSNYFEPYFLKIPIDFRFNIGTEKTDYPSYGKLSYNLSFYLEKYYKKHLFSLGNSFERIEVFNTTYSNNYWKYALRPLYRLDDRDSIFSPTKGISILTYAELGNTFDTDMSSNYIKWYQKTRFYQPLFWGWSFVTSFGCGYLKLISGPTIPIDERFQLGGIDNLRGYEWRIIADSSQNLKEQYFYTLSFELRRKIFWQFIGNIFYDIGDMNSETISVKGPYSSVGAGVTLKFSVGSISLQYGYVYDIEKRWPSSSVGRIHFSLGTF